MKIKNIYIKHQIKQLTRFVMYEIVIILVTLKSHVISLRGNYLIAIILLRKQTG